MIKKMFTAVLLSMGLVPACLLGQGFSGVSVETALMNKYIWRGIVVTGEPVIQPSVTTGFGGLSFNVWGNIDLSDGENYDLDLNEVDYTLDYSAELGVVGLSAGAIYYSFPNTGVDGTTELYAGLSISSVLNPSITLYRDVQEAEGTYVSLGIAPSIPLEACNSSLDLSFSLGIGSDKHNSFYYGAAGSAVSDFMLGLSMPFSLSGNTSLTPSIAFVNLVDSDIRDAQASDGNVLVGLSFSTSF